MIEIKPRSISDKPAIVGPPVKAMNISMSAQQSVLGHINDDS